MLITWAEVCFTTSKALQMEQDGEKSFGCQGSGIRQVVHKCLRGFFFGISEELSWTWFCLSVVSGR